MLNHIFLSFFSGSLNFASKDFSCVWNGLDSLRLNKQKTFVFSPERKENFPLRRQKGLLNQFSCGNKLSFWFSVQTRFKNLHLNSIEAKGPKSRVANHSSSCFLTPHFFGAKTFVSGTFFCSSCVTELSVETSITTAGIVNPGGVVVSR
jgi:hypothetical protein